MCIRDSIFSMLLALISMFATFPYPVTPLHLSMISGLTIGAPSFFLALEGNRERIKGRFMAGVLRKAFPGGLTNLIVVLMAVGFVLVFHMPTDQLYTVSASLMCLTGLLVLFQVCKPFTTQRKVLWGLMAAASAFCFFFLGSVFEFVRLDLEMVIVLAAVAMVGCCGNSNKKAAEGAAAAAATEASACANCAEKCDSTAACCAEKADSTKACCEKSCCEKAEANK